jgi:hypothetical protein
LFRIWNNAAGPVLMLLNQGARGGQETQEA